MIKDTYIAPEKGMVLPKATAKDMAMAASVVPNDSLSEEFRVQMDGKDKVYQDLDDVENAAHTLHYKLLKKTSAYQSFGLVSEVVGGAVGFGLSSALLKGSQADAVQKAAAHFDSIKETFKPVLDAVCGEISDDARLVDSKRVVSDIVSGINSKDLALTTDVVSQKISGLYNQHYKSHVDALKLPEEEAKHVESYFARVVKNAVKLELKAAENPKVMDVINPVFKGVAPITNAVKHHIENTFFKRNTGWHHKDFVHSGVLFGSVALGAVFGAVAHSIFDASSRKELDELNQEVSTLNRVMLTHNRQMVDMSDIPSESMKERIDQQDAHHRKVQLKLHDEVMEERKKIAETQKKPDSKGVNSLAYNGVAKEAVVESSVSYGM